MKIDKPVNKPVIVALDFPDTASALSLINRLDPELCRLKVGKELFTRTGPDFVRNLIKRDFDVFLDLKFHDIPNTVAGAVAAAADLGVWMVNVHAGGGRTMLEAARNALSEDSGTLLIAVTVLTSMGDEDLSELNVSATSAEQVMTLATLSRDYGLDGVVCSARETPMLRQSLGEDFLLVTPGIRPAGDSADDQKRVLTPSEAVRDGSDFLVIGRPVTQAEDPSSKLQQIMAEINGKK
ncbi:MAG: orotidine-5'-phosphate decarboxylase [Gammaproteobacteria bacterium]|nr:orotidine-5'-phosphate decarboxylase [Gammaproteobacteria bacterium]